MSDPTATGLYAQHQYAPGAVVAGRFRIEALLGIGGMGVVYRATDLTLGVEIALKQLRPEFATRPEAFERFRQELLMARQVSSPRVVRIHDLVQHEGQWLLGMDYIDGEGLDRRIDREGAQPPERAAAIARQLAEGLAAAHARGVIHRDLKPANVLLDRDDNAYITDFGVARSLAANGLTQSGAVIGTPDYLSPEQARGESVDARSDLYALGLILYEMLTGAMPFQGGTLGEIVAQRMLRPPPPVTKLAPRTPPWLARLTDRLLRVQPAHRLSSAEAVIRAMDTRQVPRDWSVTRARAIAATVLIAVAGVGGYAAWRATQPAAISGIQAEIAPLHRLLVLPAQVPQDAMPRERAVALAALLRDAIASLPGVAIVDGERTQQALRQLDPAGSGNLDPRAVKQVAGADRLLRFTLRKVQADRWQAIAELHSDGAWARVGEAAAGDPLAAFTSLARQPTLSRALGGSDAAPPFVLPACESSCQRQALDNYGTSLIAARRNAPAEALEHARKATSAAPDFAAAWLLQAGMAQAVGEIDAAYDAVEQAQHRAQQAPASLQRRLRAERAMLDGDAPSAAAEWRSALTATPDDTQAELGYARALGGGGDFRGAIDALKSLVARDPGDPRAWFELGKFSILAGQARQAVDDHLVRALVLFKRSGDRYGEGETANALGIGYARLGQSDDAEKQYREAVELRRAVGNRRGLATSLRNLGNTLSQRGKFDEAERALRQAGELHAELDDRAGLAAVESELGVLAEERGDFPAALAHFRRALPLWQQIGEKAGTAQALNDIGFAHYQLGNYDDAQAYLVQAADAYEALGDETGRIRTSQNLGLLAIARGRWNEARRQLDASLRDAERLQMPEEAAVSRRNLAELELHQGHLDSAIEQAGKAEALFREREDWRGVADAGLLRVQALLATHADGRARAALKELEGAIAQSSTEQRGIAAVLQSELARHAGDGAAAATALAQARQLANRSGIRQLRLQVALHDPKTGIDLERETAALGHVPLRLRWVARAMQAAIERNDGADAVRRYRDVLPMLRRDDLLLAAELHRLGARAYALTGDGPRSNAAGASASTAQRRLQSRVPSGLRDAFVAAESATAR